jgi:pimeloyl-ACP methyl ester carboxylesterase
MPMIDTNGASPLSKEAITTTTLHANGLSFNVRESGKKDPALVFLHYWGGTSRTWDLVVNQLSGLHRCVALDARGWGGSDKSAENYSLQTQADDVGAIIQSLGLSEYILVGHSNGAKIAQIFGARQPAGLKGLVLVAPSPPTPSGAPQAQKDGMVKSYQSAEGVKMAIPRLAAKQLSPELEKQIVEDSVNAAPAAKRAWPQEGMAVDISNLVGNINVPTTIIVGDADKVEPEAVLRHEFANRIKNTEFVILPGVGHLPPLEAPNELAAAITKTISRWVSLDPEV